MNTYEMHHCFPCRFHFFQMKQNTVIYQTIFNYFYQIHYFSGKIFVSSVNPRIFALSFDAAFV